MTHNASPDKAVSATRIDFLNALYRQLEPELWIELRCIHPVSKRVKTLWMPGQKRESILRQADKLNHQGYSIYFAPCPRTKQKGNAEAAALLPALWVDLDCDNDPQQRAATLEKLRAFKPEPSMILDSGGGWHAYWLWTEPLLLPDDAARQRAAGLLRGLFLALGADPEYVKSVASLMRLPDTVNTKPERGGVVVTIVEFAPERRYMMADFSWLEASSQPTKSTPRVSAPTNDGHAPLPRATLEYLAQGAPNDTRNSALFAAACQFRDAGYTLAEAKAQLIPRYLADGPEENPTAREREARATITSAYQRAARDPLPGSRMEQVKARINDLAVRYDVTEHTAQRPSAQEIAAIITECAHLEPVEWAQQRKRLKELAGEGIKAADLDRQYQHARRSLDKAVHQTQILPEGDYVEIEGKMAYRQFHETRDGTATQIQAIADWTGHILERVTQVNDDGQIEHMVSLELKNGSTTRLQLSSELFGDEMALKRAIAARAGEDFHVKQGMLKHLVAAILALSGPYPRRTVYRFMGWTELNGKLTYAAPGLCVTAQGPAANAPTVELETRLRDYGLTWADEAQWSDCLRALEAMIAVFPRTIAPACIAFALLPLLQRFFPAVAPKPALQLVGTYQSGKSELAALMSSFYGRFSRDDPPAQWCDTVNTVEALGYALANALYWVDDYKTAYADERTFTRFLQSYSRGMGRGRLTREAKLRQERPCRGLLLSTGETLLEGEASVLSRMLALDVPPWEQRDPGGKALAEAEALRHLLPAFTARFAAWLAAQAETGDFEKRLEREFATSVSGYRAKLTTLPGSPSNTGRLVQNWAVLVTAYRVIREFLQSVEADDVLPPWQDVMAQSVQTVRQERASEVFLNVLSQLVVSGQVTVGMDMHNPGEPMPGSLVVGYSNADYLYLLPELALQAINRVHPLHFTAPAIAAQLREDGLLVPGNAGDRVVVQIRVRGTRLWVWRLKRTALNGDGDSSLC